MRKLFRSYNWEVWNSWVFAATGISQRWKRNREFGCYSSELVVISAMVLLSWATSALWFLYECALLKQGENERLWFNNAEGAAAMRLLLEEFELTHSNKKVENEEHRMLCLTQEY